MSSIWRPFESSERADIVTDKAIQLRSPVLSLISTRELLDQVLDVVDVAVVIVDHEFVVRVWNQGAERTFGWTAKEVIGRPITEIVAPSEYAEGMDAERAFDTALRTGSWRGEVMQTRRDGSQFLAEVSFGVLRDPDKEVIGYVSVNRNITGHRAVEQELEELHE